MANNRATGGGEISEKALGREFRLAKQTELKHYRRKHEDLIATAK